MSFDKMMIHHCAPTLCDIKPGNIFFVNRRDFSKAVFDKWYQALYFRGILCTAIELSDTSIAVYVCNVSWVRKILEDLFVHAYLLGKGYHGYGVFEFVETFKSRLQSEEGFPHEIGVALGYPVDDVIEFENNEGKNCKYCGCWKSYTAVEKAKKCHCNYKNCSLLCEKLYSEGYSLDQIISRYKKTA